MKKLVILATKYNQTPEAQEVFNQRGWKSTQDRSTHSDRTRSVERNKHSTPLLDLDWHWWEYDE